MLSLKKGHLTPLKGNFWLSSKTAKSFFLKLGRILCQVMRMPKREKKWGLYMKYWAKDRKNCSKNQFFSPGIKVPEFLALKLSQMMT